MLNKILIEVAVNDFEYLDDFIEALANVGQEYYLYRYGKDDEEIKYMERVFAYELYHQYRKIMERKGNKYNGLHLGGEQTKKESVINGDGDKKITPDLVLHGSFSNCDGQKWVCEIKTSKNTEKCHDFPKLGDMKKRFGFGNAIFLCIGETTMMDIVKDLTNLLNNPTQCRTEEGENGILEYIVKKNEENKGNNKKNKKKNKKNKEYKFSRKDLECIICIHSNRTEDSLEIHAMRLRDILDYDHRQGMFTMKV